MVSWPAEMIRISSDLQILEKLHLLDIYDKKNQHRLSDTETLKIARHDQSIFAPCLLASSHSMAPRGNETKARAWDGTSTKKKGLHQKPRHASSTWVVWWRSMQFFKTSSDSFCWVLFNPLTWFIHGPPRSSWFFHFFLISKTFACRNFALLPYHQTFACIMDCGEMIGWEMGGDGWGFSWFS